MYVQSVATSSLLVAFQDIYMYVCIMWTLLKMFCLGDVASFAYHEIYFMIL